MYRCTPFCLSSTDETDFHFGVWWHVVFFLKYTAILQFVLSGQSWQHPELLMFQWWQKNSWQGSFSFLPVSCCHFFSLHITPCQSHILVVFGFWFWLENVLSCLHRVSSMCLVNIDAGRHLSSLWLTTTECVMWLLAGGSGIIWHWIVEHYHSRVALETIIVGSFIRISS